MDRRTYLSGLDAGALAGCLGADSEPTLSGAERTDSPRDRVDGDTGPLAPGQRPRRGFPPGDDEIVDLEQLDGAYHEPIREAAEVRGLYGVDEPPTGLVEALEGIEFLSIDDAHHWIGVSDSSDVDVTFDAELADDRASDGDPVVLVLSLENRGERTVEVGSGAPAPFGVLPLYPEGRTGDPAEGLLLWTDAYEESDHVQTSGRSVNGVDDVMELTDLDRDEYAAREYEVDADGLAEGSYELVNSVTVDDGEHGGELPFTVRLRAE